MPSRRPPLSSPERSTSIMSPISQQICEAVLQAEFRKAPRNWAEVISQLGSVAHDESLEEQKGQILDEYLKYYCRYWRTTAADPSAGASRSRGGLRLFNHKESLDDLAKKCVTRRRLITNWRDLSSYFQGKGHTAEDLAKHKYYILERFLAHWADSVAKSRVRMQLFMPNSRPSVYGTHGSVSVVADVHELEPMISRALVDSMRLRQFVQYGRVTLQCRVPGSPLMGEGAQITFTIVDGAQARDMTEGLVVSSDMSWWVMHRPHADLEEAQMGNMEEMEGV